MQEYNTMLFLSIDSFIICVIPIINKHLYKLYFLLINKLDCIYIVKLQPNKQPLK